MQEAVETVETKNKKQIVVELRAWIEDSDQIRKKVKNLGAKFRDAKTITDHYYGKGPTLGSLWEKRGEAIRIREYGPADCEVIKKEAVTAASEGRFEHGVSKVSVLLKGNLKDAKEYLQDKGYTKHLLDLKKTRESYLLDLMEIFIDEFEQFGPAMEVTLRVEKRKEITPAKEKLLKFLKGLGVKDYQIESASITNKILLAKISNDPKIRESILKEELEKFQERLKECLAKRGEAYTLGGDGWHDNAAFEALEAEYHYLTSRIDDIKSELFKPLGSGVPSTTG